MRQDERHHTSDDIFVGIDLATRQHQVVVLDAQGQRLTSFKVPHSREGLRELVARCTSRRICGRSSRSSPRPPHRQREAALRGPSPLPQQLVLHRQLPNVPLGRVQCRAGRRGESALGRTVPRTRVFLARAGMWSATSLFSRVFSCSSAFSRFAWSKRSPPYSFRHRE